MWCCFAGFCSDQCPEGFVAIAKSSLRILMVERFGEAFNQTSVRLRYTPRAFALDAANRAVYVAEADHATVPLAERPDLAGAMDDGAQVLTGHTEQTPFAVRSA